ncbi:NAD(P)H-hydrate dehydratase [Dactylosporangium sp. NPDC050588]|uniref:NAD(P)H-hydrate dehydratase n=1 Tax=Dactylosporangium sp. NPDC050588 TaxID=3157211 RepID=UPI0033DB9A40
MPTSEPRTITPGLLRDWPLPGTAKAGTAGKEGRGTVLVIGGSRSTPGAVLLAGVASLRAGAGRLQLAVTEGTATALSIAVPEAAVVGLPETRSGSVAGDVPKRLLDLAAEADAVAIGPGLDDIDETATLLGAVLDAVRPDAGVVLDAYALGALSHDPRLLAGRRMRVVLTPNVTEAGYLLGRPGAAGDDLAAVAVEVARRCSAVVTLYGTVAAPGGGIWTEESGDAGLGTSGSGDVLAGVVAGLLARGADPEQAACWGTWAHAVSGQRLAPHHGRTGFLARELLDEVAYTLGTV